MKKQKKIVSLSLIAVFLVTALFAFFKVEAVQDFFDYNSEPDMPGFLDRAVRKIDKEEFMNQRSGQIAMLRGMNDVDDPGENTKKRSRAIEQMEKQEEQLLNAPDLFINNALSASWTPLGPDPIPNGQTSPSTAVSGRTIAIAVHPTNPNIVYVGTAQGGLYRSTNGGANWTPIMDGAQSLAIGSIAISPSQPETVYVGTGEPNFSLDSYFGVGVYRIDNASTAATLSGPFGGTQFNGRGIAEIAVHPTDPNTIFVASTSASAAIGGVAPPTSANRGIYRSTNATSATPTFTQLAFPFGNQNLSVRDLAIDPLNPDLLVAVVVANGGGVIVSTNALSAAPTFTQRTTWSSTSTNELTGEIAIQHTVGAPLPTIYVATGNLGGRVLKSTDGGLTFPQMIDNNFCTPQCFYDIAIDVDPINPDRAYIGGAPAFPFAYSTTGGTSFTVVSSGIHADTHAIAVAPSSPSTIYLGTDGGIYKSTNSGATFNQLNSSGFRATQFMSLDTHPTNINLTIGGTQDNGTNMYKPDGTWTRVDYGDGGYAVIDQSAAGTAVTNMYHTYFNSSSLAGYAWNAAPGTAFENWQFRGCNGGNGNGIVCSTTVNFYAPLERGPSVTGSIGNAIYYGSDRLYRSIDTGLTNSTVSQIFTSPLSAIGVSPQNDSVRVVGLNNGGIFGTTAGATTLTNLDPSNVIPDAYVARAIIDPNDSNTAYITLAVFNVAQIYKTTNLNAPTPTWTAVSGAASGLPLIPVSAFAVDSGVLYAGTDIGVYASLNGGTNWTPLGIGLPKVAVFDMAFAGTGTSRVLRIATHGKGMYQIPALQPILSISGTVNYALDNTKKVQNVGLAAAGDSTANATSIAGGSYTLNNLFTSADYTVTPSKTGDASGITSFDATLILRCVAAGTSCTLSADQKTAGDANSSGGLSSFDATLILRYVAAGGGGSATGDVGKWKFTPASRNYTGLSGNATGENYGAILVGEVNGNW